MIEKVQFLKNKYQQQELKALQTKYALATAVEQAAVMGSNIDHLLTEAQQNALLDWKMAVSALPEETRLEVLTLGGDPAPMVATEATVE